MNKKVIATILALGMVAGAFAMMAAPVNAASNHGFWWLNIFDAGQPIILDAADGQDINGGAVRHYFELRPGEVNDEILPSPDGGAPYPGTSDIIGPEGNGGADDYAYYNSAGFATNWADAQIVIHLVEVDANEPAGADVYINNGVFNVGAVPNGYVCAGREPIDGGTGDTVPNFPDTWQIEKMPLVDLTGAPSITWAGVTGGPTVGATAAEIDSWELYESVGGNTGPWTQVGTAAYGAAINYAITVGNYYSARVTWTGGVPSLVMSEPATGGAPPVNEIAAVINQATTPNPHNGNTVSEFVTITADITDLDAADVLSAEYRVDGGAWVAFAQTGVSPLSVSGVYNFPAPFTEGAHTVEIRGYDGTAYSPIVNADFTVTDTTAPIAAWNTVPAADAYIGNDLVFTATYEDFSDFQAAGSYLTWTLNGAPQANVPFVGTFTGFGSYLYTATATIATGGMTAGDVINYGGQLTADSAAPQATVLGAGGPITMQDPPSIVDPFPVYGAVVLYDGTSVGGYNPIAAPAGVAVDVQYFDFVLGAVNTISTTTDASGFYTVDIMNAVLADPYEIEVVAGPFTGYGNMGYNNAPVADYSVGGVQVDVICGIPYEVTITTPLPLSNVIGGTPFNAVYEVWDIDGVLAQGYFSHEGAMDWTSTDALFVSPGPTTFEGTATGGTVTDSLTLWTAPQQTIRIADEDGGVAPPAAVGTNMFLTPWGDFGPVLIGGVSTQVYMDDWDEIILNILADSFDWNVVNGWNIVSAPMDPIMKGLNGVFDGADALAECNALLADPTLALAMRDNLGVYTVIDLSVPEAAAFAIDGVHGYWVYSETGGVVTFSALDYDIVADPTLNQVAAVAGWNLLGFTHNFGAFTAPDADYLTTTLLSIAMTTKCVATYWDYTAQWYYSYVLTPTFVMPSRNWVWDFSYSAMPGNGFYLWLDAAQTITFDVVY